MKSSTILRLAVVTVMAGGFIMPNYASAQSFCNISGCIVVAPPSFGGGYGGGGYPGGGGGSGDDCGTQDCRPQPPGDPAVMCPYLRLIKPQSCPSPIALPSGYDYGRNDLPSGSAMRRMINLGDGGSEFSPLAASKIRVALGYQVSAFSNGFSTLEEVTNVAAREIESACKENEKWASQRRFPGVLITESELECMRRFDAYLAEANNRSGFWAGVVSWASNYGLDLGDFGIPQTIINLASPDNSVAKILVKVEEDTRCAIWWREIQFYQCSVN